METYCALFAIALVAAVLVTPVVRRTCEQLGWFDVPADGRRVHARPIPRLGGVAIFLSFFLALGVLLFLDNEVSRSLHEHVRGLRAVLVSSTLIFLFGLYDDLRGSRARWKFLAQGLAASILYLMGGHIEAISFPLVGQVNLPPALSFVLTQLWVISICNAFNLIDGLDGLAAGASLFASLVMLGVSLLTGQPTVTVMSLALSGALIGFLRYNFNPASIFLGDSGSLFIGFLLAALSVTGSQKASTAVAVAIPLMAFALPIIDTGLALVRRFISGKPLFAGDKEHIHHKLLELGWSQRRVAFVLYGACAVFGILALLFTSDGGQGRLTALLLLVTGTAVIFVAGRLRYHEVDEVRAGIKRNLMDRRVRAANHVQVRRAAHSLSRATTLKEMLTVVRDVLEMGEFAYATVQLGRGGDSDSAERVFFGEREEISLLGAELRGGLIYWDWRREDVPAQETGDSHFFWALRLHLSTEMAGWGYIHLYREFGDQGLLIDVNYLSNLFQKELAQATERVFTCATSKKISLSAHG
jgi:UDP-GlcNAc:undecaprenyl-phosphate GlcNAc-1-phosphate transferase